MKSLPSYCRWKRGKVSVAKHLTFGSTWLPKIVPEDRGCSMAGCRVLSAASFSRSQNNSDKSRSVDNSACSDALAVPLSNSDRSATQFRDRGQPPHLTIAAFWKVATEIPLHSSCRNYQQRPAGAIAISDSLSDLGIFAKFDLMIFDFAMGSGQAAVPGITSNAPRSEAVPDAQKLPGVSNNCVS